MRYLLGAALLASVAAPALAQDNPRAPFTGPRVEGLAGYDRVGNSRADSRDGFVYGIGLGYDFQAGGAVIGIEGEATDSTTAVRGRNLSVAGDSVRFAADRDLYVGARVGFAVAPATLLYAKGGYTNARFKTTYSSGSGASTEVGNTLDGYRVGVGVEQKFNLFGPSGYVKAEYRYSNYSNLDAGPNNVGVDIDRHQALVGLGIRF